MTHQRTVTYNGETFGTGTDIGVVALRGLEALDVDLQTPNLPRYHGGVPGDSFAVPRVVEVELMVRPSNRDRALRAFHPSVSAELALTVVWDDEDEVAFGGRLVFARVARRGGRSRDRGTEFNAAPLLVQLEASDPAIYGDTLRTASVLPFTDPEGFSYPVTYPKVYGAGGTGGVAVENGGDWETWPVIKIHGPTAGTLTDPIVENVTTGQKLDLSAHGGVGVGAGQTLVINTHPQHRSIRFTTGASRYGNLTSDSEFWLLPPGASTIRFRGSGATSGASTIIEWRDAWI